MNEQVYYEMVTQRALLDLERLGYQLEALEAEEAWLINHEPWYPSDSLDIPLEVRVDIGQVNTELLS